jgi:hypothetical protein
MDDLMAEIARHGRPNSNLDELEAAMTALQEQMAYIYDLLNQEISRLKQL